MLTLCVILTHPVAALGVTKIWLTPLRFISRERDMDIPGHIALYKSLRLRSKYGLVLLTEPVRVWLARLSRRHWDNLASQTYIQLFHRISMKSLQKPRRLDGGCLVTSADCPLTPLPTSMPKSFETRATCKGWSTTNNIASGIRQT